MNILSVDTASNILSVSLKLKNSEKIQTLKVTKNNNHLVGLVPLIKKILFKNNLNINELDLIAVNEGPGSYTGLRIGITTLRTIALLLKIKIFPIDSLMSVSLLYKDKYVLVKNDARANEIYSGLFYYDSKKDKVETLIKTNVFSETELEKKLKELKLKENIVVLENAYPSSKEILKLALINIKEKRYGIKPELILPKYLKKSEAERNFIKNIE